MLTSSWQTNNDRFELGSFGAFLTAARFRPLRWPLTTVLLPPATRHSPLFRADAVRSIRGEPGRSANRQAFPSSPYPANSHGLQHRQIERISFRASTNTHRAPPCGLSDARAFTSYRIGKEHPHDPDILSLRRDCPTLAGVSGKWSLLDGRSAIATGWFPSLSSGFALFSDEIS